MRSATEDAISSSEPSRQRLVTLAAVCMRVVHNKDENLETFSKFLDEASEKDVDLIAFPECSLQGYTWSWDKERQRYLSTPEEIEYFNSTAETVPGPTTDRMIREARDRQMLIQFGMVERVDEKEKKNETRLHNSAVLVGPDGLIGVFRKVHMAPNPIFSKGTGFSVFETPLAKVGPIICADLYFPESVRCLALAGAELVINSTAWGMNENDPNTDYAGYTYELLSTSNALMNQVWIMHSAQIGGDSRSSIKCYGHSRIVDPMGRIVADTGYNEGLALAKVDVREGLVRSRGNDFVGMDLINGRQPEAYRELCGKKKLQD